MSDLLAILACLSDGEFHSGESLAREFKVSRTAIWKQVKKLNTLLPMQIHSVQSKGYKINDPIWVLNKNEIRYGVASEYQSELEEIEVSLECGSTNQYLLDQFNKKQLTNYLVVAEMQTQGRGRRGSHWISPFACNIYMSYLWSSDVSISEMSGLSLIVAISIAKALQKFNIENVMLKWPNDVYVEGKKLSGILLELRCESNSPCSAVIGMGINVNMPKGDGDLIEQQWTDMQQLSNIKINRNLVIAEVLNNLIPRLKRFNTKGFSDFIEEWKALDLLENKPVNILGHATFSKGVARGVNIHGALLVEHEGDITPLYSGEASVREQ